MRGVGGPLLTIGDLVADLVEDSGDSPKNDPNSESSSESDALNISEPLDLTRRFQENYDKLNNAFAASDHSWTSLTLELCTALQTANKLVHTTTTNARSLSEKMEELKKIVKRGDSAVAAARTVHATVNCKGLPTS